MLPAVPATWNPLLPFIQKVRLIVLFALAIGFPHKQAHQETDHAHDQGAPESRPETVHREAHPKLRANQTGQVEHEGVDQQHAQPEGQNDHRAAQCGQNWAQHSIHNPKDKRQDQVPPPLQVSGVNPIAIQQAYCQLKSKTIHKQAKQELYHIAISYKIASIQTRVWCALKPAPSKAALARPAG